MAAHANEPTGVDGVVLAGGVGRRFGRPKAGVHLGGETLVARAVSALVTRCDRVVVVARHDTTLPEVTVPIVHDAPGPHSALVGVLAGLRAVDAPLVAVLGCDVLAAPALLDRIIGEAGEAGQAGEESRVALDDHGLQPLCARYRRLDAITTAETMIDQGQLRLRPFAEALAAVPVRAHEGELRNVNTWIDGLAASLDVPAPTPEVVEAILDLTRIVAHGTERPNGPVASFLAGYLAATSSSDTDPLAAIREVTAAAESLIRGQ